MAAPFPYQKIFSCPEGLLMRFGGEMPAAAVANMENDNGVVLNGEQHAVYMRLAPIEKLAHLERKFFILRGKRAAFGKLGKRIYRFSEFVKPSLACIARLLRKQPFQNAV